MEKTKQWRDLGRPEAALIGVQYRGNDRGEARGPGSSGTSRRCRGSSPAPVSAPARRFGEDWGIEIDADLAGLAAERPGASPRSRTCFGPGLTAQMTYYETRAGAKVFAAGAFTLAGAALEPGIPRVLANLWAHLARA